MEERCSNKTAHTQRPEKTLTWLESQQRDTYVGSIRLLKYYTLLSSCYATSVYLLLLLYAAGLHVLHKSSCFHAAMEKRGMREKGGVGTCSLEGWRRTRRWWLFTIDSKLLFSRLVTEKRQTNSLSIHRVVVGAYKKKMKKTQLLTWQNAIVARSQLALSADAAWPSLS
jgi:hypothetical protein